MKKYFFAIIIALCILAPMSFAEDWDDFSNLDRAWDGQKTITNKEFEEVMDALQANQKKKEAKQRKKAIKKIGGGGTSLHSDLNPDKSFSEIQKVSPEQEGILVNVPVHLMIDGNVLEKGYYKLIAQRDEKDKKIYILFYQSQFLKGKVQAEETEDDFGEENLDFARLIPYNNSFVKMVFGCIDFNAFAYIPYSE